MLIWNYIHKGVVAMGILDFLNTKKSTNQTEDVKASEDDIQAYHQLKEELKILSSQKEMMMHTCSQLAIELNQLQSDLADLEETKLLQSYGLYEPRYDFENTLIYKEQLLDIKNQLKQLVKDKKATEHNLEWTIEQDKKKESELISNTIKLSLRTFNSECEAIIAKAKYNNLEASEKRLRKIFSEINALTTIQEVTLSPAYLELKIAELYLKHEGEVKKQEEKEEEKALKELESTKKKVEKEVNRFKTSIQEIHTKLETASASEKTKLLKKLQETQPKLEKAEETYEALIKRGESARAGYVYILSNIGAFGEDVYKIGFTRKLDPQETIQDLNSESVPFNFDIHALIFSKDALTLKENLHKQFAQYQLNKVNGTKDFFKVSLSHIEQFIEKECEEEVNIIRLAEAEEYKKSCSNQDTRTVNSLVFSYTNT